MKKLLFLLVLVPGVIFAQDSEYLVIQNVMIEVEPQHRLEFEAALTEFNKTYHSEQAYGARVYNIMNGPNSGKYIWSMAMPWSTYDSFPNSEERMSDWHEKLASKTKSWNASFWRWDSEHSAMPETFEVNKLMLWMLDVEEYQMSVVNETMKQVKQVYDEKIPDQKYGLYINELPDASEGRDIAIVSFFESFSFMSYDPGFVEKYEEMNGEGSFEPFINKWLEATNSTTYEVWSFNANLSGLSSSITRTPN